MENEIYWTNPSNNVEIFLPDGMTISAPRGTTIGKFLELMKENDLPPIVGAIVNGEIRELTYPINIEANVKPVTMGEADGMRIYRRSLTLLLDTAFSHLFPEAKLTIDHSISSGGYFCQVKKRCSLSESELQKLEQLMQDMVKKDIPFVRRVIPLEDAITYFKTIQAVDKLQLLAHRKKDYLTVYQLEDHLDYHHGYMVPSTGYLRWFSLSPIDSGFTLRFPRRHAPTQLLPLPAYPKLLKTFRQYGDWLEKLGISNVGALNKAVETSRSREIILVSEALHEQYVSEIAAYIAALSNVLKIILIAGPSSSGKTTFSKRLSIQLLARGVSPFPLELDNYFVDRDLTPKDESGEFDYESIDALNRSRLSDDLVNLIGGKKVQLPKYNFIKGKSEIGQEIQLMNDNIIILEGLHGLNPDLIKGIANEQIYRIYVSALTQINLDRHNRVSTTDTRLIRRIVRDARERGYTAQETIRRWESVRRGERRYIFPYQENCDVMFNSALVYELSTLKPLVKPLLLQVPYGTTEYVEAKRLIAHLDWFLPMDSEMIPDNSILREFLGNSILKDFTIWHTN